MYTENRICDAVLPRRICEVRGLSESQKAYSIFSIDFDIPLLGEIPIDPEIVNAGDSGEAFLIKNAKSDAAKAFEKIVGNIEKIVNKKEVK